MRTMPGSYPQRAMSWPVRVMVLAAVVGVVRFVVEWANDGSQAWSQLVFAAIFAAAAWWFDRPNRAPATPPG